MVCGSSGGTAKAGRSVDPAIELLCRGPAVDPKPVPPDEVLTSRIAGEQSDNALEAWGEEGWATVGRLCRFYDERGMPGLRCPPATRRLDPG